MQTEIRPQPGPQTEFLCSPADIVVYGGAAGGGKTWALLLECLRHVDVPGFNFVIFRRTFPQITSPGGLWDESLKLFPLLAGDPLRSTLTWKFPSGAWGRFSHLQHEDDVLDWQGSQVCLICWDELTHFTEHQFWYLLSRNRSMCGVKPYIRCTTNPDAGSWVKKFLAPWVDKTHPNPAKPGEIRWFVRLGGEIVWVDQHYSSASGEIPKSMTFIPSRVTDNLVLMETNPEYIANLMALPPVERARLLDGDWDILADRFFKEWRAANGDGTPWHVIPTGSVDDVTRKYVGIDYGYAAPWAAYLCGVDSDGRVTVYRELYGCEKLASAQAHELSQLLLENGVDLNCTKYAGHDVFAAQRGAEGRQEPIVEIWRRNGMRNVVEAGRDPVARAAKLREYLTDWGATEFWPTGRPGIQIMQCCTNLLRTLPLLKNDTTRPEMVDTDMEDHGFDALTHFLSSRPGRPILIEAKTERDPFSRTHDWDDTDDDLEPEDEYR